MDQIDRALTDLIVAASSPVGTIEETRGKLVAVLGALGPAGREARGAALGRLADLIVAAEPDRAAVVAVTCGFLVERGDDPLIALAPILDRLPAVLAGARDFADACRDAAKASPVQAEEDGGGDVIEAYGERVAAARPREARDWIAVEGLALGAIAMLSRSPEGRHAARGREALLGHAQALAGDHGRAGFLAKMLQVLDDEELLVLHPGSGQGYRVVIRGVADNFQLHILLADALIGDAPKGWIPGKRPDPRIVAAAKDHPVDPSAGVAEGAFNLVGWRGLRPDKSLADDHAHWIWNEGIPADIPPFEGVRTILLGPPPYHRSWNAGRIFSGMPGELRVAEVLDPATARGWLGRIAGSTR